MNQHQPITRKPFSGAVIFNSAEDMLTAMFGPAQHDTHVGRYRRHQQNVAFKAACDARDAEWAAKVKQYGSYTAWLRAEPAKLGSGK